MVALHFITPVFAVAPQIESFDLADLAKRGFRSVIDNRPDEEPGVAVSSGDAAELARAVNQEFAYLPAGINDLFDVELIDRTAAAIAGMPGPIIAYCKSGTRSAILWALATVRYLPVDEVLRLLKAAGYELSIIRQDLAYEATRYRALNQQAA